MLVTLLQTRLGLGPVLLSLLGFYSLSRSRDPERLPECHMLAAPVTGFYIPRIMGTIGGQPHKSDLSEYLRFVPTMQSTVALSSTLQCLL